MASWTPVILLHTVVAALAILLGAFNALRRTRGDRLHRAVGRTWTTLMLATAIPSFWIGGYADGLDLFLHGLAVVTIVSVSVGWWAARTHRVRRHARCMSYAYLGLIGAFIGVLVVPDRRVPTAFREYPGTAALVTLALIAAAGAAVAAMQRATVVRADRV